MIMGYNSYNNLLHRTGTAGVWRGVTPNHGAQPCLEVEPGKGTARSCCSLRMALLGSFQPKPFRGVAPKEEPTTLDAH